MTTWRIEATNGPFHFLSATPLLRYFIFHPLRIVNFWPPKKRRSKSWHTPPSGFIQRSKMPTHKRPPVPPRISLNLDRGGMQILNWMAQWMEQSDLEYSDHGTKWLHTMCICEGAFTCNTKLIVIVQIVFYRQFLHHCKNLSSINHMHIVLFLQFQLIGLQVECTLLLPALTQLSAFGIKTVEVGVPRYVTQGNLFEVSLLFSNNKLNFAYH